MRRKLFALRHFPTPGKNCNKLEKIEGRSEKSERSQSHGVASGCGTRGGCSGEREAEEGG